MYQLHGLRFVLVEQRHLEQCHSVDTPLPVHSQLFKKNKAENYSGE